MFLIYIYDLADDLSSNVKLSVVDNVNASARKLNNDLKKFVYKHSETIANVKN